MTFTMSDSFLVLYDFGILSMIKRKLTSFWFLLCHVDFKFVAFDFSNNNFDFQSLHGHPTQNHSDIALLNVF